MNLRNIQKSPVTGSDWSISVTVDLLHIYRICYMTLIAYFSDLLQECIACFSDLLIMTISVRYELF